MSRSLAAAIAVALLAAVLAGPVAAQPSPEATAPAPATPELSVDAVPDPAVARPGEAVEVNGSVLRHVGDVDATPAVGAFATALVLPSGERVELGGITTAADGTFSLTVPADVTAGVDPAAHHGYREVVALELVEAASGARAGAVPLTFAQEAGLQLDAEFQSFTGWVKPGDTFPLQVRIRNFDASPSGGVQVTAEAPPGAQLTDAVALNGSGDAAVADGVLTWTVEEVPAADEDGPGVVTAIVEGRALDTSEDPEVVWKDLSVAVSMTGEGIADQESITHGPKVIPPATAYESARYGDKRFPMVPAEYTDRSHQPDNTGEELFRVVNDPGFEGSMFNLYQEMSYGQLHPEGLVPSAGVATATFSEYEPGFDFTQPDVSRANCRGVTLASTPGAVGSPLFDERIVEGWYQLPGNTEYYGGDYPAFTLGVAGSIDSACGQLGKGVYDAATIADPEIDYNDFDSDKDGVVDFFMLVFVGCGGNGASQLTVAACPYTDVPYDNIWPHSSDLQMQYRQEETGLRGYVSDDQLVDLEGRAQCWTDDTYTESTTCTADGGEGDDALPTFVRVGPYNVNPETAIDSASVFSHEYGHYLGLPDFYSSYDAYGSYNLMASDFSQHMTIFAKQELGWVVPEFVDPGESVDVQDWAEIKTDTGEIRWQAPDGTPYTLSAENGDQNIHNGEAYGLRLPPRIIIEEEKVAEQASAPTVWWSGRGNDFGCSPDGGHNLDIYLPELAEVPEGSTVELTFKSSWDIEWDWDYGFVLVTTDGLDYTSQPSEEGYTTSNAYNPNNQQCMADYDNGITGQSGSYEAGPQEVAQDRNPVANDYSNETPFLTDRYDLSEYAGQEDVALRFSYFTDAAFDRPGWFIDDVVITVDGEEIYASDFEGGEEDGRIFNGGCDPDQVQVARVCTPGWSKIIAGGPAATDHAYYLELRDRIGFDYNGYGQSDRGDIVWEPGVFVEYTDEAHGYGNNGVPLPPAQHYLDSQPVPGEQCPVPSGEGDARTGCYDWSFTDAEGRSRFSDVGMIQSFSDPEAEERDGVTDPWVFDYNCLTMDITRMEGLEVGEDPALPGDLTADATITGGPGCEPVEIPVADEDEGQDEVVRVAGPDRIATSIELSQRAFEAAPAAVLARADAFPDALAASALAAQVGGPILLTGRDGLDPRVEEELSRLGARTVYLAGGEAALSEDVAAAAGGDRVEVVRLGGADRYETAALIAAEVVERGGPVERVTVALGDRASGDAWPDALAAGSLATAARVPVLLTRPDSLPAATSEALESLVGGAGGGRLVYLAGGEAAVSAEVEQELTSTGYSVTRLAGPNRFATAVAIAEEAIRLGATVDAVYLASGGNFPDALATAPAAAAEGGVLLLVDPAELAGSPATAAFLEERREDVDLVVIAGGEAAVAPALEPAVLTAILDE